jgi:hypothetical protein
MSEVHVVLAGVPRFFLHPPARLVTELLEYLLVPMAGPCEVVLPEYSVQVLR